MSILLMFVLIPCEGRSGGAGREDAHPTGRHAGGRRGCFGGARSGRRRVGGRVSVARRTVRPFHRHRNVQLLLCALRAATSEAAAAPPVASD
jgi:hypothetical protein